MQKKYVWKTLTDEGALVDHGIECLSEAVYLGGWNNEFDSVEDAEQAFADYQAKCKKTIVRKDNTRCVLLTVYCEE